MHDLSKLVQHLRKAYSSGRKASFATGDSSVLILGNLPRWPVARSVTSVLEISDPVIYDINVKLKERKCH